MKKSSRDRRVDQRLLNSAKAMKETRMDPLRSSYPFHYESKFNHFPEGVTDIEENKDLLQRKNRCAN